MTHGQSNQPNRLIRESSPYLLQHAHNPVDWHPWGEEALAKARAENKLLLVSIGYSSCHWCHVMERESFVDPAIAALMNAHYVCVKVDREERPDVDHVYMAAVQLMTGRGGWPLNCFALPDGRPVYGGTYFPPEQWSRVLADLDRTWQAEPKRVMEQAARLQRGVAGSMIAPEEAAPITEARATALRMVEAWKPRLDQQHGGADRVPKFPMPNNYQFLLRLAVLTSDNDLLQHVELTLVRMAMGGIFDWVGGGFARYSTDALWKVPHFEKMLYDNAQLVSLYSQAYQVLKKPLYKEVVALTIGFIEQEMSSPEGAFFSAIDADSEGEEGLFYVWSDGDLQKVLGPEYDLARAYFDIGGQALWEHDRNILRRGMPDADFARAFGIGEGELDERLARIRTLLMQARSKRVRPGLDDKSLTSWNALMVTGLCDAHEAFGEERWLGQALRCMEHLLKECRKADGGLRHSWKSGAATINGYLEDYAFTIEALLALYGLTFNERWLTEALALAEHAIRHFRDEATGFFHFTSDQDAPLIARPMELEDNVIPASNSAMARCLFVLGAYFDDDRLTGMAEAMLASMLPRIAEHPSGHSNWGQLALMRGWPLHEIAITGPEALRLRRDFAAGFIANRLFLGTTGRSQLPLLRDKALPGSMIFVCVEKSCQLPVPTVQEALSQLR
ncbi:MAG: thioredoxin domain-containing protein [Flavobacteriales bacterium]|nr:thioredoxin domain-containing protein [Flavobacteriales bacterium]